MFSNFPSERSFNSLEDNYMDLNLTSLEKKERKSKVRNALNMAIAAGEIMLQAGAETYRVQDTVIRLCKSIKIVNYVDVFVIPTGIFLTIGYDNNINTIIKRTNTKSIDLNVISLVNQFSREFVTTDMTVEQAIEKLHKIKGKKTYSTFVRAILGGGFVAGFTSLLLKGTFSDFLSAFFISAFIVILKELLSSSNISIISFVKDFFCACVSGILAVLSIGIGLGDNLNIVIIGAIMPLVPGFAITNATRDTIDGDFLSGLSRGTEAILCALSIASGVGVVLQYLKFLNILEG